MNKHKLNCILLIDDDEPTNFMSTIVLEEAGCTHHIEVADNGQKALDYLTKALRSPEKTARYPDLIFLDINMPAMNGWEFLARYTENKLEQHPKPIIIMLTTSINPDDKARAESMTTVAAFECKPLTASLVEQVIKRYFSLQAV